MDKVIKVEADYDLGITICRGDNPLHHEHLSFDEVVERLNRLEAERDAAQAALEALCHQIDINDFMDSLGHPAKGLQALHEAAAALRGDDNEAK